MLATSRRAIQYPNTDRTDRADIALHLSYVALAADADVLYDQGTDADRIAADHQADGGRYWWTTDTLLLWYDDGTNWHQVGQSDPGIPLGAVIDWPWASGDAPSWALLPYGQAVLKATYADLETLAASASHPYGSDSTHLNLPDYRGRVGAGKDDMGGTPASRITSAVSGFDGTTLGVAGGAEGVTLSSATIPAHTHSFSATSGTESATHTHDVALAGGGQTSGSPGGNVQTSGSTTSGTESANHTHSVSGTTGSLGSGGAHLNTQPTIIVNKIMRVL